MLTVHFVMHHLEAHRLAALLYSKPFTGSLVLGFSIKVTRLTMQNVERYYKIISTEHEQYMLE